MAMNPLAAILAAHQPAGPPQGQPPSISVPDHGGPAPGGPDPSAALKAAIQAVHQAAVVSDDQTDKQTLLKCLAAIQNILATEQKQKEAALGTTAAHKGLAKASASY
jgi:hypothetical protein